MDEHEGLNADRDKGSQLHVVVSINALFMRSTLEQYRHGCMLATSAKRYLSARLCLIVARF